MQYVGGLIFLGASVGLHILVYILVLVCSYTSFSVGAISQGVKSVLESYSSIFCVAVRFLWHQPSTMRTGRKKKSINWAESYRAIGG